MQQSTLFYRDRLRRWTALVSSAIVSVVMSTPSRANVPEQARVDDILGNSSELLIRRSGRRESIQMGSVLQQVRDALITAPPNNARALLRFLSAEGEDLNLYVQTNPHTDRSIYYFPCQIQGGDYLIGWGLARNEQSRGCENGMQIMRGQGAGAQVSMVSAEVKEVAQGPVRQVSYCSASDSQGKVGLATSTAADPCAQAIAQCEAAGGSGCEITATGFWWTSEPQIEAALTCGNTLLTVVAGTGETIEAQIPPLLSQGQGANCRVKVLRPDDFVIVPASNEVVTAQGDDEILVQTRDTPAGLQVDVLEGAINVQTSAQPQPQPVTSGQRYVLSDAGAQVNTFDRAAALTSVDMEVLCAFASQPDNVLSVSACQEGLGIDTTADIPIAFCNREQASGGQLGDRRVLQMSASEGEIKLDYEMFEVPDQLQIFYEDQQILDTGFVSGSNSRTIPFQGKSGRLEVVVTGNPGISTTEWNYLLQCP